MTTKIKMRTVLTILLSVCLFPFRQADTSIYKECIIEVAPRTRTFESLLDFQSNKLSFAANHSDYQGNYVAFEPISIKRLATNTFVSYESDKIIYLNLSNKDIDIVEDGAFNQLFCLHFLDLSLNEIEIIRQATFTGLENLRSLNISFNKISFLPELVFENLHHIKVIDASENNIIQIDSLAFRGLFTLEALYLDNNKLTSISETCFQDLSEVGLLELYLNRLKIIKLSMFTGMYSLNRLDLAENNITNVDFENVTLESIKYLNLSHNLLDHFDIVAARKHLPNLIEIHLNANNLSCPILQTKAQSNLNISNLTIAECRQTDEEETYLVTSTTSMKPKNITYLPEQPVSDRPDPWEKINLHRNFTHTATNWLIVLFCIMVGLGVVFVLDFFFAGSSLFRACSRGAMTTRYGAPLEEYLRLNAE